MSRNVSTKCNHLSSPVLHMRRLIVRSCNHEYLHKKCARHYRPKLALKAVLCLCGFQNHPHPSRHEGKGLRENTDSVTLCAEFLKPGESGESPCVGEIGLASGVQNSCACVPWSAVSSLEGLCSTFHDKSFSPKARKMIVVARARTLA